MSRSHSLKVLGNSFGGIGLVTSMVVRLKLWECFLTLDEKDNFTRDDITYGHESSFKSVCSILFKTS